MRILTGFLFYGLKTERGGGSAFRWVVACIPKVRKKILFKEKTRGMMMGFCVLVSQAPRDDVRARHLSAQRADTTTNDVTMYVNYFPACVCTNYLK